MIDDIDEEDWLSQDGTMMGPHQYASYIGRALYNQFVVAGKKGNGDSLLAFVDHQGTYFEDNYIATGFGAYLAMPLLRNDWSPNMTKEQATELAIKCLKICFYRDCRAYFKYTIGCSDGQSVEISPVAELDHFWEHEAWMKPSLTGSQAGRATDTW